MDTILAETTKTCNGVNCNNKAVMYTRRYGYLCKYCYGKVRSGVPIKAIIRKFANRPGKLFIGVMSPTKH